jgi:hypothetical protein
MLNSLVVSHLRKRLLEVKYNEILLNPSDYLRKHRCLQMTGNIQRGVVFVTLSIKSAYKRGDNAVWYIYS